VEIVIVNSRVSRRLTLYSIRWDVMRGWPLISSWHGPEDRQLPQTCSSDFCFQTFGILASENCVGLHLNSEII
jgi:hypothetical protein